MCGRFSLSDISQLRTRFGLKLNQEFPTDDDFATVLIPRYNIAPTQIIPAIINRGSNELAMFRWGLIPAWAKDAAIGPKMINARAETIAEKPSFRTALQRRRCLIPADGFYEWQKVGRTKQPYRIILKGCELFGFAGLWDTWNAPTGELINSCTIITTTPNELMEPLHNRMPVIMPRELEQIWLDQGITDQEMLKDLLKPYPAELMKAYEVSTLVNSPHNDRPECLLATPTQNTLELG